MVGQIVYAASGLVEGDNEANANRLYDAMFPHNCMVFLFNATKLPMEVWKGYIVGPWAPLVSILLKLTLFEGESVTGSGTGWELRRMFLCSILPAPDTS